MAQRDETFQKFGPLLLEGVCIVMLDFHNESRREQGKPEITMQEFLDILNNHLSELQPYDWMQEVT